MNERDWNRLQKALAESGTTSIAATLTRQDAERAISKGERHPGAQLLLEPTSATARVTEAAFQRLLRWTSTPKGKPHKTWWKRRVADAFRGDDGGAAGALAEIRALAALLSTADSPTGGLCAEPYVADGRAPDFRLGSSGIYVEVCCARMNAEEDYVQRGLDELDDVLVPAALDAATKAARESPGTIVGAVASAPRSKAPRHQADVRAVSTAEGRTATIQFSVRGVRPGGPPTEPGELPSCTAAKRLVGKKPPGQAIKDHATILWMDFCDPGWTIRVEDTRPADLIWKQFPLASTQGVWHAFYGRAGRTRHFLRAPVSFEMPATDSVVQKFDGKLRALDQTCWSAAILRCTNGVVVFEHPAPDVRLPFRTLCELLGIEKWAPDFSFHRLAEDDHEGLERRLEDVERRLDFYNRAVDGHDEA